MTKQPEDWLDDVPGDDIEDEDDEIIWVSKSEIKLWFVITFIVLTRHLTAEMCMYKDNPLASIEYKTSACIYLPKVATNLNG